MADLQFLHITDTHFLNEYNDELEKWGVQYNPTDVLKRALSEVDFSNIDFVVHTGDIVHEGDLEDYKGLKNLMEELVPPEISVFYCLGNHDKKAFYHEVFENEIKSDSLYYVKEFKGYKLIFLDTSSEEIHDGVIDQKQADWLKSQLENNDGKENLIFQHHPLDISWVEGLEKTEVPSGYYEILSNHEIKGIFTGHLHQNRHYMVNSQIPQHTANSLVFGMTIDDVWNNNRLGYSVVKVLNGNLDVFTEIVNPVVDKYNQNIL